MTNTGAESPLYEITLPGATAVIGKDVALSFMERVFAASTIREAAEDITATVTDADPDDTDPNLQLLSKPVAKTSSDTRNEIISVLADLGVLTKPEDDSIIKVCLAKLTDSLQSNIINAAESTFEDTLQLSDSSSNKGLKMAMFNVLEHALEQVVHLLKS